MSDGFDPLRRAYVAVYALLCGRHPFPRPWHYQWLATRELGAALRRILPTIEGRVLDVGCGDKPYRRLLRGASSYVGLDVPDGGHADVVVQPGQPWPLEDSSFDAVLSTEVLEHAEDFEHVLAEIARVLRPGGLAIITTPFIYNEHGAPGDFRRLSLHGATRLFPGWETVEARRLGRAGSAMGTLLLNWIDLDLSARRPTQLLKGLLMPLWIALSAVVNAVCIGIDAVDATSAFYTGVLVTVRRPPGGTTP